MASPDNYMIGKGIVSIAKWTNGVVGAYNDVGNCPKFEIEPTEKSLEHFASRSAVREQDAEIVIESGYNVSFTLDEIAVENLRMFLKATLSGTRILYANQNMNQYYAIKFVSDNPTGKNATWEFFKLKVTPQGAFSLISEEFTVLSFSGKGMSDRTNHEESPFFTTTFASTTTTTTTTSA